MATGAVNVNLLWCRHYSLRPGIYRWFSGYMGNVYIKKKLTHPQKFEEDDLKGL